MLFGIGKFRSHLFTIVLGLLVSLGTTSCAQSQQAKLEESHKHEEKAHKLRLKQDFHGALQEQLKAVELNPNDSKVLAILGSIYIELHQTEKIVEYLQKAKEVLEQAVKADPNDDVAHDMLAGVLDQLKDDKRALQEQRTAVKLKPENLRYLTNLGVLQNELNDNVSARETYQAVLQKNPNYVYALYHFGSLEVEEHNYDKAVQLLERALKAKPVEEDDSHFQETAKKKLAEVREQITKENAKSVIAMPNKN